MQKERLSLNDSMQSAVQKMSDGNMGAFSALMEMFIKSPKIDPQNGLGGFVPVLMLDSIGIYGADIYVLHSDICGRDMAKTLAVIRAVQLGLFDSKTLKDACSRQDYSGRDMVPVDDLYSKVQEQLIEFDVK